MKLNNEIIKMIANLEYLIASECYNPNSYDYDTDSYGKRYRYPLSIPNNAGEYKKIKYNVNDSSLISNSDITLDTIRKMHYKLGSNHFHIELGILRILEYLEEQYHLDFNEIIKE